MAYADAETGSRKLAAGAAVVALELGLGLALINGLSYTRTFIDGKRIGGFPLPSPSPTKTPPPPTDKPTPQGPIVVPTPIMTLGPANPTPTPTDPATTSGGGETGTGTQVQPTPTPTPSPSPKPLYQAKGAKPKGDTSRWLTTEDYPMRSIRERQEGRTGYRLTIDADGRVTNCAVTGSSGFVELDTRACQLLPRRAKFEPARDTNGAAVIGSYTGNIQWRLPPEE